MVEEKIKFSYEDAQLALLELDEALAAYSPFVPKDQLGGVHGHIRNAKNGLSGRHWSSCVRNAQRAQGELSKAAAPGFRKEWGVKTARLLRQINAQPEPSDFQELRTRIDQFESGLLEKLRVQMPSPEVMGEFRRIVDEIPKLEKRFEEIISNQRQPQGLVDRAQDLMLECGALASSYPKVKHPQLELIKGELVGFIRLLGEIPLKKFTEDPQLYEGRLQDLIRRLEEYREHLARAFRPKSEKNVTQRGRPRKQRRSTRGSGRYSRRKRR